MAFAVEYMRGFQAAPMRATASVPTNSLLQSSSLSAAPVRCRSPAVLGRALPLGADVPRRRPLLPRKQASTAEVALSMRSKQLCSEQVWRRGCHVSCSASHSRAHGADSPAPNTTSEIGAPCSSPPLDTGCSSDSPSPSTPDGPVPELPPPLSSLALRLSACRQALLRASPHLSRPGRLALWFISGQYIPSQWQVLVTLLRAERFYRRHIRSIDPQQLLHELNFFPELPDLGSLFPLLAYTTVLSQALVSSVAALGSLSLQGSASVPGLPEVELPTISRSVAYEYPDKSDQPETPGYKPLGEWLGPRGLTPWERNAKTLNKEETEKQWERNMKEYTLQPYNSTPKERRVLVGLAIISQICTQFWILLHAILILFLFIGFMAVIEKPLLWAINQVYKLRWFIDIRLKGPITAL